MGDLRPRRFHERALKKKVGGGTREGEIWRGSRFGGEKRD